MSALLAIEVSPRLGNSISRKLTVRFIEHWMAAHPDGEIIRRDLMKTRLPFVDLSWIGGAFTPPEQQSPEMKEAIRGSDELIAELMAADHLVIGTPMFNFSIPAALKAYIDHIVRVGVTVTTQYEGALRGKRATVILAAGSSFAPGTKWESCDSASAYLRQILGFIGINEVAMVIAGGTLAVDNGQTTFADFAAQFDGQLSDAARGRTPWPTGHLF
ncbi:MAG TPA: NAD(P)H-dependent oxidoreductase [Blastocatellia bacterium]|nr:NAD(P)H-dependent oxidoreductase [Blastocatellia bacterium]